MGQVWADEVVSNWTSKNKKGFDIQKQWGECWLYKNIPSDTSAKAEENLLELIFKILLLLLLFHGSKDEPRTTH